MALEKFTASGRFRRISEDLFEIIRQENTEPKDGTQAARKLAVLICKDAASRKWGPKWLEQAGFTTLIAATQADLQLAADSLQPALLLVESGLRARNGEPLHEWLAASSLRAVPRLVLCSSERDVEAALECGAVDVVRKPYNWQVISKRATRLVHSVSSLLELDKAQEALGRALNYANDARQFLQRVEDIDPLTELPNRRKFSETIDRILNSGHCQENGLAIMLIGIDRFRSVNDSLGHAGGNEILAEVGRRIQGCLAREDLLGNNNGGLITAAAAKLGGVRFGLMLSHGGSNQDLARRAEVVQSVLAQPISFDGQSVYLGCSMGISVATRDGDSAEHLILNAESALLEIKKRGGGIRIFRDTHDQALVRRIELERKLRDAINNKALQLHYQPLICNQGRELFGVEALLRWTCPEEGRISPAEFVPVAEEAGLMVEIGDFVIRESCRQLREWLDQGLPPIRMAMNLSLIQLLRGNIVRTVRESMMDFALDPALLELELSERGVVKRDPEIMRKLQQLRALGVRLSVDDFGSGEASISYLKHLPVDTLKIDRSYVSGCASDERDQVMGMIMATLGKKLGLTVVAEGVETAEQLEMVQSWGCDASQGFYFSPAVSSDQLAEMLRKDNQL